MSCDISQYKMSHLDVSMDDTSTSIDPTTVNTFNFRMDNHRCNIND